MGFVWHEMRPSCNVNVRGARYEVCTIRRVPQFWGTSALFGQPLYYDISASEGMLLNGETTQHQPLHRLFFTTIVPGIVLFILGLL